MYPILKIRLFIHRQGGIACMPAAKLALEDVNGDKNLLPGFKLILHSNDSEVRDILICISGMTNLLLLTLAFDTDQHQHFNRSKRVCICVATDGKQCNQAMQRDYH